MNAVPTNSPVNGRTMARLRVVVRGAVQGVGFRPFIYRLARDMRLAGDVSNNAQGVFIDAEGPTGDLQKFLLRIEREKPPLAFIQSLEATWLDPRGASEFVIRESTAAGKKSVLILPDVATCPDCLSDIFDPNNRRHLYPFTNCTNCGPRFTIIKSLPYDRANTSMERFVMCADCRREYEDPQNRRFHAQPNACPVCGPRVELWGTDGKPSSSRVHALLEAVEAIRKGKIVAVKGLGGFHLIVDGRNEDAVARLRERKHREEKPFALMYPSLDAIKEECIVPGIEERVLVSPESPIVLLRRKDDRNSPGPAISLGRLAANVAPSNPYLGVMLPYTPLHHILMRELAIPVVATSGNLSDEPICTDEREALDRLGSVADLFLVHNRPIVRHVDDSIVRIMLGRELVLRRARGYAPLPVAINRVPEHPVVAVGAHLKNTIAVSSEANVFVSQHIGDLETKESFDAFEGAVRDFQELYEIEHPDVVCDMHPDYLSSQFARRKSGSVREVQHHYAHVAACVAENQIDGPVLGVSWDGTGFGPDGTVWGGEFLATNDTGFERVASLAPFMLPGGDAAVKEPRRSALGVLYELFGADAFTRTDLPSTQSFGESERHIILQMLAKGINSPRTSSAGRLFDAVASILGLRQRVNFEGQAAMELEFLTTDATTNDVYPFEIIGPLHGAGPSLVDWKPLLRAILDDVKSSREASVVSTKFHNTLAAAVLAVAVKTGLEKVVLTGGCFQNVYLTEKCVKALRDRGFRPYWHQRIPPNDGGISLGQIYAVAHLESGRLEQRKSEPIEEVRT